MTMCAWCEREFSGEKTLVAHIRRRDRYGHGNLICNNCKQPLSKCEDIIRGTGSGKVCKTKEKSK